MSVTVTPSTKTIASCGCCGKSNYDSQTFKDVKKEVDQLFALAVNTRGTSNMTCVSLWCAACLRELRIAVSPHAETF